MIKHIEIDFDFFFSVCKFGIIYAQL